MLIYNATTFLLRVRWQKAGTIKFLANEVTVPANSVVDITDKNSTFYLEETDLIRGGASAGTTIDCIISYEKMAD